MGGVMANQAGWVDILPPNTFLESDSGDDSPLVVDVGGNIDHDLKEIPTVLYPGAASRLDLKDRPEVVKLSKCPDPVLKIGYDFFTPQPIKGKARRGAKSARANPNHR